jgi:hypothetical protein
MREASAFRKIIPLKVPILKPRKLESQIPGWEVFIKQFGIKE